MIDSSIHERRSCQMAYMEYVGPHYEIVRASVMKLEIRRRPKPFPQTCKNFPRTEYSILSSWLFCSFFIFDPQESTHSLFFAYLYAYVLPTPSKIPRDRSTFAQVGNYSKFNSVKHDIKQFFSKCITIKSNENP